MAVTKSGRLLEACARRMAKTDALTSCLSEGGDSERAPMTTTQTILFAAMLYSTPSMLLLAWALRDAP
jgi:hypothetical protein